MTEPENPLTDPIPLPAPEQVEMLIDFDGTITQKDVLDELIARYAVDESWRDVERQWQAGLIGSRECLSREFAVLRVKRKQIHEFLDLIALDGGAGRLFRILAENQVPVTIVSDGVEAFIVRLLARLDQQVMPENLCVRANTIRYRGNRIELLTPHASPDCESAAAHCKCHSAWGRRQTGRHSIYVGDGLSDLCPARKADFVFAKSRLAVELAQEGVPFYPYETLDDVAAALAAAWSPDPLQEEFHSTSRSET